MAYVINTAVNDTFVLRDNSNVAITGKTNADFATVEAYEVGTPATTAAVTITEIGSGKYRIAFTPTTATIWTAHIIYDSGGVFREFEPNSPYDVITAAQADPAAALASTVSAVTTLTERLTSARAAKLDRIGSDAQIVEAGTLTDGDRLDIRRGDSYLAADGNSKQWTYDGPAISSATLTLRTYAGVTALSKAVTLAGTTLTAADITAVETAALSLGTPSYRYEIVGIYVTGGTQRLTGGEVWVAD